MDRAIIPQLAERVHPRQRRRADKLAVIDPARNLLAAVVRQAVEDGLLHTKTPRKEQLSAQGFLASDEGYALLCEFVPSLRLQ